MLVIGDRIELEVRVGRTEQDRTAERRLGGDVEAERADRVTDHARAGEGALDAAEVGDQRVDRRRRDEELARLLRAPRTDQLEMGLERRHRHAVGGDEVEAALTDGGPDVGQRRERGADLAARDRKHRPRDLAAPVRPGRRLPAAQREVERPQHLAPGDAAVGGEAEALLRAGHGRSGQRSEDAVDGQRSAPLVEGLLQETNGSMIGFELAHRRRVVRGALDARAGRPQWSEEGHCHRRLREPLRVRRASSVARSDARRRRQKEGRRASIRLTIGQGAAMRPALVKKAPRAICIRPRRQSANSIE